jgi:hypothetical protein
MKTTVVVTPQNAHDIGTAAEHIVCADIIIMGHRAFLAGAGLSYDVVADVAHRLVRIQVKAAGKARNVNARGRSERVAYTFAVRTRGNNHRKRLDNSACDVVALVALDLRIVAYFPVSVCGQTVQLIPLGARLLTQSNRRTWANAIDDFPFAMAISSDLSFYERARREVATHCRHGHLLSDENMRRDRKGYRACLTCLRKSSLARYYRNKRLA